MQVTLYNGTYAAEGEPMELAVFLALHIDAMHKVVDKNQQEEAKKAVADLLRKLFSKPDEKQEDE